MDELLKRTGGEDALWAAAGHQARRAWSLATPSRQQDGTSFDLLEAARAGQAQRQRPSPAGHSGRGLNRDTGRLDEPGEAPSISRAIVHPVQVADAEAGVVAQARHTAALRLTLHPAHAAHAEPPQLQSGAQPSRSRAND